MILTSGGRFGGYGFYLLKGKPVFLWNWSISNASSGRARTRLTPGRHTVEFDFKYDGLGSGTLAYNNFSGVGRSGTGTLKVDGKVVATKAMEKTLPMILQWDESFDIGSDTLTGVNDADYKPPFPLTGKAQQADDQDGSAAIVARRHKETPGGDEGRQRRTVGGRSWFAPQDRNADRQESRLPKAG